MTRIQKLLLSTLVVGALGSLTVLGVFGLFSATTQNAGNEISTGTVTLTDNDAGSALYNVTGAKPGDTVTKCIKVSYSGSLEADVHMYTPSSPGTLAQYTDLVITQGTQATPSFPDCTGFSADAVGQVYSGTLQAFEASHSSYANGLDTDPAGVPDWSANTHLVFKLQATLQSGAPDTAQGASTGVHSFVWEARNN